MRAQRGITFVTVLLLLAIAGGVYWVATFGSAYWENQEVKATLREAANFCYREKDDRKVRDFIVRKLHAQFDLPAQGNRPPQMAIDFDPADVRIERTETPKKVDIWLTYSRTVKTPLLDQERSVTFTDHADQDLSAVKW